MLKELPENDDDKYDVESIEGFKFNKVLKFYTKWDKYPRSCNSFEPTRNLTNCIPFRTYIDSLYSSIQIDIELNNLILKKKLKSRILASLSKQKQEIFQDVASFDEYEFKAYQVVYHLIQANQKFNQILEDLFVQDYIVKLERKQFNGMTELIFDILKADDITVDIENDVDFTLPSKFKYITCSIKNFDSSTENEDNEQKVSSTSDGFLTKQLCGPKQSPGLLIFKTKSRGWGLKTLQRIEKGSFIVEYVGEIVNKYQVKIPLDQYFVHPAEKHLLSKYSWIDATRFGNLSRFINHSYEPNCLLQPLTASNDSSEVENFAVVALRDIEASEEITFNYSNQKIKLIDDVLSTL